MSKAQKGVVRPLWIGTAVVTCVVFGSTINKCLTCFPASMPGTRAEAALVRGELMQRADAWSRDVTPERYLERCELKTASLFEAASGERHWMERIGPHYSASPVEAEGLVHFLSDEGVTTIIRPGTEFEKAAENQLGEDCYASPAISRGRIYIRAEKHLYCIGSGGE